MERMGSISSNQEKYKSCKKNTIKTSVCHEWLEPASCGEIFLQGLLNPKIKVLYGCMVFETSAHFISFSLDMQSYSVIGVLVHSLGKSSKGISLSLYTPFIHYLVKIAQRRCTKLLYIRMSW